MMKIPVILNVDKPKVFLLAFIWLLFFSFQINAQTLSQETKISLITVGPGEELYSGFGHSAFWIYDPTTGLDKIYNYGTFDFNEEFYVKFVRGKLDYRLSISDFAHLAYGAQQEGRYVEEQILELSQTKKEELYAFLETNYLPENRYYRYDFFLDNCSSRLRDALATVCKSDLKYDLTEDKNYSFRQMIDQYLDDKAIQDLGMDIGLGAPSDRKATPFQYMFLPEYLKEGFDKARIKTDLGWKPLVKETVLHIPQLTVLEKPFFSPFLVLSVIAIIVGFVTFRNIKYMTHNLLFDKIWLFVFGLLGIVLVFLWFFTDHNVTINNWDLWWANPIHLVALILFRRKTFSGYLKYYFLGFSIVCLSLLIFWRVIPEEFNIAVLPILLILLMRAFFLHRYFGLKDSFRLNK